MKSLTINSQKKNNATLTRDLCFIFLSLGLRLSIQWTDVKATKIFLLLHLPVLKAEPIPYFTEKMDVSHKTNEKRNQSQVEGVFLMPKNATARTPFQLAFKSKPMKDKLLATSSLSCQKRIGTRNGWRKERVGPRDYNSENEEIFLVRARDRPWSIRHALYPESFLRPSQGHFPKVFLKRSWSVYLRRSWSVPEAFLRSTLKCTSRCKS